MRTVRYLAWAAALAATIVVSVEVTVRLYDWAQYNVPLLAAETMLSDLVVRDSLGMHARPGGQFRQFRINRLGARGAEQVLDSASNSVVIIASGASETFGLYERPGGEWPRQLEDSLGARCRQPVQVINAAFAGMALPTVQQDLHTRWGRVRATAVMYYPTPMQYMEAELPTAAPLRKEPPPPLNGRRSRAFPRLRDAIKRAVPEVVLNRLRVMDTQRSLKAAGAQVQHAVPADRLDAFERDLRALVGAVRARNAAPILMIHRNRFRDTLSLDAQRKLRAWERFYPLYSARAILLFDDSAAVRTARVGADSAALVVDPLPAIRALDRDPFADFSHFTDRGSAVVGGTAAHVLAPALCPDVPASRP